ncbi:3'-5' exonuclease [Rappaport israeli]|uniref:3'-5' exonuclease n=1 Tax=Rappaport israeli TaxID=1839807 RepID=UPI000930B2E0|nr:3'-5' exonuclease [Rappaport israeli]
MNQYTLIFDIETVADVDAYRQLNRLEQGNDDELYHLMANERLSESGHTFMRHPLHKIVAISLILKTPNHFKLWSLGDLKSDERELIQRFFQGIDKYSPTLVSWNGSGFDLPVLHYRALFHHIQAPRYFDIGDDERDFKYNNYLSRFHWRHIDLMDVLSGFQSQSRASLNDIAKLCGFPGKLDIDGQAVQTLYSQGNLADIRHYCETDVLNTYLVYLRFEHLRGNLTFERYQQLIEEVQEHLQQSQAPHLQAFLEAWADNPRA